MKNKNWWMGTGEELTSNRNVEIKKMHIHIFLSYLCVEKRKEIFEVKDTDSTFHEREQKKLKKKHVLKNMEMTTKMFLGRCIPKCFCPFVSPRNSM